MTSKLNLLKNNSFRKFLSYSVSSLFLFLIAFFALNTLIFFFEDKIFAAKITFAINFCNSFIYYCLFYNIKKKISFFLMFVLNSIIFRFFEFNFLVSLLDKDVDHNVGLFLVLGISHTIKYYYYLILLKFFKLDIN